jgi:hypothetical protein
MAAKKKANSLAFIPRTHAPDAASIYMTPVVPGLTAGVLRREFSPRINSSAEFTRKKLHPAVCAVDVPPAQQWNPTCHRSEVLLPAAAPDLLADGQWLLQHYERAELHDQPNGPGTGRRTFTRRRFRRDTFFDGPTMVRDCFKCPSIRTGRSAGRYPAGWCSRCRIRGCS